jgi:hypothetical protein
MEDEYEEVVEESLLLIEFTGNTGDDAINQENNVSMKILGVESEEPIIQMGKQLYRGEYQDSLGTELFFREVEGEHSTDTLFDTKMKTKLEYCGKTSKKILIHRAFVENRESNSTASAGGMSLPNVDVMIASDSAPPAPSQVVDEN